MNSFYRVTRSKAAELQSSLNKDINKEGKKISNGNQIRKIEERLYTGKKRSLNAVDSPVIITPQKRINKKPRLSSSSKAIRQMTPGKATIISSDRIHQLEKSFLDHEVSMVYKVIRKQTGALGGNGAGGAIYGEITQKSFQRVIDYLKGNCELNEQSMFLDIGSGLGKPNFHAAVDPGVEVSYGVELEVLRWHLSLHNLKSVIQSRKSRKNRVMFSAGDITNAETLDPFTHIYSFDVGFPPSVMDDIAIKFNQSNANYFISFHSPKKVIELYGFEVENIGRLSTSMAGSSEGHSCYVYKRKIMKILDKETQRKIDPLFSCGFALLERGNEAVTAWIENVTGLANQGRTRRQKRQVRLNQISQSYEKPLEAYYPMIERRTVSVKCG